MHARLDRGSVRLLTRTGLDWTHKYPAIAETVPSLGARQAYLDGELCGVGPRYAAGWCRSTPWLSICRLISSTHASPCLT
jgi:hypothetical protein